MEGTLVKAMQGDPKQKETLPVHVPRSEAGKMRRWGRVSEGPEGSGNGELLRRVVRGCPDENNVLERLRG